MKKIYGIDLLKIIAANFLLIFSGWPYFSMTGINNPTWYCCILIQCYIVFFILIKAIKAEKIRPYLFVPVAVFSFIFYKIGIIQNNTFRGLSSFFIGCCLCGIYKHVSIKRNVFFVLFLISVCLIAYKQRVIFFISMFAALILLVTQINFPASLHEFSRVSFEVFIWHSPLMDAENILLSSLSLPSPQRSYLSMFIFTFFVWLWAWIIYRYLEIPINKFLKF